MVAFSPIFAIPYENPLVSGDQPGVTLHGGNPPIGPANVNVSALRLDEVLAGLQAEDVDLDARVTLLEAAIATIRWRHITEGSQVGGTGVQLAVPAGFKMLRLYVWGDTDQSTATDITLAVNNDAGNNHVWGFNVVAADGTTTDFDHSGSGTNAWRIGRWTTTENNNAQVNIFPTDGVSNPSFVSVGHRDSANAAGHQSQLGYGKFAGDVVVSSLSIGRAAGNFADINWLLEGYLSP